MSIRNAAFLCWVSLWLGVLFPSSSVWAANSPWAYGIYFGKSNSADILELGRGRFEQWEPYHLVGVLARRDLGGVEQYFELEWHSGLALHQERLGLVEGVQAVSFAWKWFPWSKLLNTTLSFGEGLSWASGYPSSESVEQKIYSKWMNFLVAEFRVHLPKKENLELLLKLHHRSAAYGLFNDYRGGSNYVSLGLVWRPE